MSINIYSESIASLEEKKKEAQKVYDGFLKQIDDPEELKKLSYYEQRALAQNGQNYKHTLSELAGGIEHFLVNKMTPAMRMAAYHLEDMRIEVKDLVSGYYDLEELARDVSIKEVIDRKKFDRTDYKGKVNLVRIAAGRLRDDIKDGDFGGSVDPDFVKFSKWNLVRMLGKIETILQEEIEQVEEVGMPKPIEYELPKIIEPEVPEEAPDQEPATEEVTNK